MPGFLLQRKNKGISQHMHQWALRNGYGAPDDRAVDDGIFKVGLSLHGSWYKQQRVASGWAGILPSSISEGMMLMDRLRHSDPGISARSTRQLFVIFKCMEKAQLKMDFSVSVEPLRSACRLIAAANLSSSPLETRIS